MVYDKMEWNPRKFKEAESKEGEAIIHGNEHDGKRQKLMKSSEMQERWE